MKALAVYLLCGLFVLGACGDDAPGDDPGGDGSGDDVVATYSLSGQVVDFRTLQPIEAQAAVATDGISPPPAVGVRGADFEITEIPPGSLFHVLAAAPGYRSTYANAFEIVDANLEQAEVRIVSDAYLSSLIASFDATLATGAVLIVQLVDETGTPVEGVAAADFEINNAADFVGPYFLDNQLAPAPARQSTDASGYAVFFAVKPGLVTVNAAVDSGYTMSMAPSPAAANTVTLATVETVRGDRPQTPANVSFKNDVLPIFELRGCAACHSKKEIGNEVGGLSLDMKDENKLHKEIVEEISERYGVARVDLLEPEQSLILTQPSPEDPPDGHPNITFRGPSDPDYQLILAWIREGAVRD